MYVCALHVLSGHRDWNRLSDVRSGIREGYGLSHGYWKSNSGPLQEQPGAMGIFKIKKKKKSRIKSLRVSLHFSMDYIEPLKILRPPWGKYFLETLTPDNA